MGVVIVDRKPDMRTVRFQGIEYVIRYVFLMPQKRFRWVIESTLDYFSDRAYNPLEYPAPVLSYLSSLNRSSS